MFTKITGYSQEEVINKNPRILNAGTQPKEYYTEMWKTITNGKTWHGEFHNKKKNGELYLEKISISPLKDEYEKITHYLAIKEDITKLKESERKHKQFSHLFRLMTDNIPDLVWAKDLEGEFTFVNKAVCEKLLIAKDTEEPIGKDDMFFAMRQRNLYPKKNDWHTFGELCVNSENIIIKNKKAKRFDEYGNVQGKFLYLDVYKAPIFDDNGDLIGTVGHGRIVTKEKEIEKALKESELKYKALAENAVFGVVIHNAKETLYANNKAAEILGYKIEEQYNVPVMDFVNPNFKEKAALTIQQILTENVSVKTEDKFIKKDGSYIDVEVWAGPITFNNQKAIQFTFNDITKRKQFEEELKESKEKAEENEKRLNAFSNGTYEALFFSKKGICIDANVAATNMFGYTYDELIGILGTDVIADVDKELVRSRMLSGYELPYDATAKRKDNTTFDAEFQGKMFDYYGEQIRVTAVRDISIRKKNERLLEQAKQKAEESDQLKTEFLHNMSHEIRTPMNAILGFSNFLNEPNLTDGKKKNYITIIQNSGNQLLRIIDDILEVSSLETKQVRTIEKEICLNDLLLELFSIFDIKAKENKTPLYLNKGLSDKESIILTDETKLNKILSNLLENALKFTNTGFVEFGYRLNNNELEIYVKDTGIGIKPENHEIIFKRFSQEEKSLSRKVGGLGLGLSICKENAELLGGKITVKSEKGKGATFYVTIPYKPISKENINSDNNKGKLTDKQNKYTILVVEDEEVNFIYLDIILKKSEYNLTTLHAKHGKEAVELCKENAEIDLVLMDIKMPIMSGFEATKLIKQFRPDLPIVAQTAYSTNDEKQQAFTAGCDDLISKPISDEILNGIINKHLIIKK